MKCPGQDMQFWKPGDIYEVDCPGCGRTVEFFKDDTARRCGHCGHRFANPKMDFGCAAYCPYAEQCIGDLPPEVAAQQENLLKDKVAIAVKRHFGRDFKSIGHASRVARYAEQIAREEKAVLAVVLTAAYLLDVDKQSSPVDGQPAVARSILEQVKARPELADQVCALIALRHEIGRSDDLEARILHDALLLARLEERKRDGDLSPNNVAQAAEACRTAACRRQAQRL
ncbi:MAG: HD domain-containing protein [Desulfobacterales bacterium]|nr:HD domain-containing protein [Desulfobacterales bacterium]